MVWLLVNNFHGQKRGLNSDSWPHTSVCPFGQPMHLPSPVGVSGGNEVTAASPKSGTHPCVGCGGEGEGQGDTRSCSSGLQQNIGARPQLVTLDHSMGRANIDTQAIF